MEKYSIEFKSINQIQIFIKWAEKIPYEMDLSRGSICIDAKSLMGLISLGINNPVDLIVYGWLSADTKQQLLQDVASIY